MSLSQVFIFKNFSSMVRYSLLLASLVVLCGYLSTIRTNGEWKWPLAPWTALGADLTPDAKSYTTITAVVAAVLNAITVDNIFPESRTIFSEKEITGLTLFFAAMLIIGPLIYNIWRPKRIVQPGGQRFVGTFSAQQNDSPGFDGTAEITQTADGSDDSKKRTGVAFLYLVSFTLILTATIGQLLIVLVDLTQIEEAMPTPFRVILALGVVATVLIVCLLVLRLVRDELRNRRVEKDKELAEEERRPRAEREATPFRERRPIAPQRSIPLP